MACCPHLIKTADILRILFEIAPQFITDDPVILARYTSLIESLRCMINERAFGCCGALAFANLLAHYLMMQLNPSMGITNSLSEGQLSISYASTVNSNFYMSSPYGQAYMQLLKNTVNTPLATGSGGRWNGPACCGNYRYGFWPT